MMPPRDTKSRQPLFERIKTGLEEGIEFTKGNAKLRTIVVSDSPLDADEVRIAVDPESEERTSIKREQ